MKWSKFTRAIAAVVAQAAPTIPYIGTRMASKTRSAHAAIAMLFRNVCSKRPIRRR
jgi:hypothetical protein